MNVVNHHALALLEQAFGVAVAGFDAAFLENSLRKRMAETHCGSPEGYCALLGRDHQERALFSDALHINYSDFFRNPLTFSVLERIVLPSLILKKKKARRKGIRIWSAACAAGQEAYSLSMLLEELLTGGEACVNYRVFATDQGEAQVNEARQGRYATTAIGNLKVRQLERWFTKHGETYTVKPELGANIDFAVFDLFSERLCCPSASIFGDFDLVVCANLLLYYKPGHQDMILEKLGNALAQNGFLVVGETERSILVDHGCQEVFPQTAIFKRKTECEQTI